MIKSLTILFLFISSSVFAQNLFNQRIRKLTDRKQSIYFEDGIFHNGGKRTKSELKALRHSYHKGKGYDRTVFEFKTAELPRLYGHFTKDLRRIHLDFFGTDLSETMGSFGNSKFVKSVNFFPVTNESLSVEIELKKGVSCDIFFLNNPGRLVLDLK